MRDHRRQLATIFSLQRFEQRHPILQGCELLWIQIHPLGITGERARQFLQLDDRRFVGRKKPGGTRGVEPRHFAEHATRLRQARENGRLALVQFRGGPRGKFDQPLAVRSEPIASGNFHVFVGLGIRVANLAHLVTQQFQFALHGILRRAEFIGVGP